MSGRANPSYPVGRLGGRQVPAFAVLGPCPCIGCGQHVFWAHSQTRMGWDGPIIKGFLTWREPTGRVHKCIAKARKAA